ncbi:hypothetical protein EMIT0P2_100097 [Pseudomonas sp. IT-P2]
MAIPFELRVTKLYGCKWKLEITTGIPQGINLKKSAPRPATARVSSFVEGGATIGDSTPPDKWRVCAGWSLKPTENGQH